MDLTFPLLSQTEGFFFHREKARSIPTGPSFLRNPGRAGLYGTPSRRQPGLKNGVKKQKLHDKNIISLEEIFKIVPKIPQQMSKTFPTTPSGHLSGGAEFGSSLASSLGSLVSENEWDFPGLSAGQEDFPAGRCVVPCVLLISQLPGADIPWQKLLDPCPPQVPPSCPGRAAAVAAPSRGNSRS